MESRRRGLEYFLVALAESERLWQSEVWVSSCRSLISSCATPPAIVIRHYHCWWRNPLINCSPDIRPCFMGYRTSSQSRGDWCSLVATWRVAGLSFRSYRRWRSICMSWRNVRLRNASCCFSSCFLTMKSTVCLRTTRSVRLMHFCFFVPLLMALANRWRSSRNLMIILQFYSFLNR